MKKKQTMPDRNCPFGFNFHAWFHVQWNYSIPARFSRYYDSGFTFLRPQSAYVVGILGVRTDESASGIPLEYDDGHGKKACQEAFRDS